LVFFEHDGNATEKRKVASGHEKNTQKRTHDSPTVKGLVKDIPQFPNITKVVFKEYTGEACFLEGWGFFFEGECEALLIGIKARIANTACGGNGEERGIGTPRGNEENVPTKEETALLGFADIDLVLFIGGDITWLWKGAYVELIIVHEISKIPLEEKEEDKENGIDTAKNGHDTKHKAGVRGFNTGKEEKRCQNGHEGQRVNEKKPIVFEGLKKESLFSLEFHAEQEIKKVEKSNEGDVKEG